jgi:hypothetical protein
MSDTNPNDTTPDNAPDANGDGIPDFRGDGVREVGVDLGTDGQSDYRARVVASDDPEFDYVPVPKTRRARPKPVAYEAGIKFTMPPAQRGWTWGKLTLLLITILLVGPLGYWLGYSPAVDPKTDAVRAEAQRAKDGAANGERTWWLALPSDGRKKLDRALKGDGR